MINDIDNNKNLQNICDQKSISNWTNNDICVTNSSE